VKLHGKALIALNYNQQMLNFIKLFTRRNSHFGKVQSGSANLFVLVSKGNRQNLLGRNWIDSLKLDPYHMNTIDASCAHIILGALIYCYSIIFRDVLGHCHKLKVHLTLKPDANPKF